MDSEVAKQVATQAFELWINPEIERRRQAGNLAPDFSLYAAQVIFDLDRNAPEVRLNSEVNAVMAARATRPIAKGEAVTMTDFSEIDSIHLAAEHDPNAAHLTLVLHRGNWNLAFDFRYNTARIAETAAAAREFLDCAAFAIDRGQLRAGLDNLFSATELMAKGLLLALPDKTIVTGKKHTILSARFNLLAKHGNADARYPELLKRLSTLRPGARYLEVMKGGTKGANEMLGVAEDMHKTLMSSIPKRVPVK